MEQWIQLAELAHVPDGTVRRFRIDFRSGWLIRRGETIKAYLDHCTHAGGMLMREGETFVCHRHGGTFDVASGKPLAGPPVEGDPLLPVELKIEDGKIFFKRVLSDD